MLAKLLTVRNGQCWLRPILLKIFYGGLFSLMMLHATIMCAQSPGGISTNLAWWYKGNAGITKSGSNVTIWKNQSAVTGLDLTQATSTNRPIATQYQNFNPIVTFDGSDDYLRNTAGYWKATTGNTLYNVFAVASNANTGGVNALFGENTNQGAQTMFLPYGGNVYNGMWGGQLSTTSAAPYVINIPYLWTGRYAPSVNILRNNGADIAASASSAPFNGANNPLDIGACASNGWFYNGAVGEVLMYNADLTTTQRQQVESYLALKWGITLVSQSYIASDGSTAMWNAATAGAYTNNIAGIGNDVASGLDQKQSQSINTTDAGNIVTIGLGTIAATNAANSNAFTVDKTFESWSDNGGTSQFATPINGPSGTTVNNRMTRVWKVQETGTVGTVKVGIPSSLYLGNALYLVRSSNSTFDATDQFIQLTSYTAGSTTYYAADIDFNNGDYFSFATYSIAPGGVNNSLAWWYKGDAGLTTSGSAVTGWNNQSGTTGLNTTQPTIANRPQANQYQNFNRVVTFDGSDDYLRNAGGYWKASTGNTQYNVFAVTNNANTGGINSVFNENTSLGDQVLWIPYGGNIYNGFWASYYLSASSANYQTGIPYVWSGRYAPSLNVLRNNGADIATTASGAAFNGNNSLLDIGGSAVNGRWYSGNIAEVLMYSTDITSTQRQQVESYLAIKWGISLSSQDYLASDGTTKMWSPATAGNYTSNVAGIGRDDNAALAQKQSKSINSGNQITIGLGTIAATNPANVNTLSADKSFETWSDNGAGMQFLEAITGPVGVDVTYNLLRSWKVQETGTVGTVQVGLPASLYSGNTIYLVRSTNSTFNAADEFIPLSPITVGGINYYAASIDFNNGDYFTFATNACGINQSVVFHSPNAAWSASATSATATSIAAKAIDGKMNAAAEVWESAGSLPQSLTIDYGTARTLSGIIYYQRTDGGAGAINGYSISTSTNGVSFTLAKSGNFQYISDGSAQSAIFSTPASARYVRITATSVFSGSSASVGEILPIVCGPGLNAKNLICGTEGLTATGTDATGTGKQPALSLDLHWEFARVSNAFTAATPPYDSVYGKVFTPAFVQASSSAPDADFITPYITGSGTNDDYYYRYRFFIPDEATRSTFSLGFLTNSDDQVRDVFVNGIVEGPPVFPGPHLSNYAFTLNDHWKVGLNEIILVVSQTGSGPTYLLAQSITKCAGTDYGDAPDSYNTLSASTGAGHAIKTDNSGNVYLELGTSVTAEADGQPSATANTDSGDDGIASFPALSGGPVVSYSVTVNATNYIGADAHLVGWIDFNNNGTFEAGEGATATVSNGSISIGTVLTWTNKRLSGGSGVVKLIGRFRISTDDALTVNTPGGVLRDGEVEDYAITATITAPAPISQNILVPNINNTSTGTILPPLSATDPSGNTITSYTIGSIPSAATGTLNYCPSGPLSCVAVNAGQTITDPSKLTFVPAPSFTGNASFTYSGTSANGTSNMATVTIPIVNMPPVAQTIITGRINSSATPVSVYLPPLSAMDGDGTISSFTVTSIPASGTLTSCSNGTIPCTGTLTPVTIGQSLSPGQAATLQYTPASGITVHTPVSIGFTATDNNGNTSNNATMTIPVEPAATATTPDMPPVVQNITASSVPNTAGSTAIPGLSASDPDGNIASFTVLSVPSIGTLTYCTIPPLTGCGTPITAGIILTPAQATTISYTPDLANTGSTPTFNYTATDNNGNVGNTATVRMPVYNPPPVTETIYSSSITSGGGQGKVAPPNATDNGTIATYTLTTVPSPAQGTLTYCTTPPATGCGTTVTAGANLTPGQAATLSFTPATGYSGTAVVTFTATDNNGAVSTSAGQIKIPVEADGAAGEVKPMAENSTIPINANTTTSTPISMTATDADGTVTFYEVRSVPPAAVGLLQYCMSDALPGCTLVTLKQGTVLTPLQAATISYTPNSSYSGPVDITYVAYDNDELRSNIGVIRIDQQNQTPIAQSTTTASVTPGGSAVNAAPSASDPDGSIGSYTITSVPPAALGSLTYCTTPPSGNCGTPVTAGLVLTPAQAATMTMTPNSSVNTSLISYGYTATDNTGKVSNPAIMSTPVNITTPLPLDLLGFNAGIADNCTVSINWKVANEQRIESYRVERSVDGNLWEGIATINAINTSAAHSYTSRDEAPLAGISYYRLRIADNTEMYHYSSLVKIKTDCATSAIQVYPNPVKDKIYIRGISVGMTISITDMAGRTVRNFVAGENIAEIDMSALAAGAYHLLISSGNEVIKSVNLTRK